jgi:hypothetical protein
MTTNEDLFRDHFHKLCDSSGKVDRSKLIKFFGSTLSLLDATEMIVREGLIDLANIPGTWLKHDTQALLELLGESLNP